jgi:hypothetical protein
MAFQFAPLLIGAGVGALGGLLTGRDPLKGALIGGATGGLLGGLPAGAWGGGGATVAGGSGAGVAAGAGTAAPSMLSTGASFADDALAASSPATFGYNASGISPFSMAGQTAPMASDIGAGFGVDNIASMSATNPTMWDEISPYLNVRDLTGAAMVGAQFQQRPQMPTAPAGGVTRGQAPQGTDVMALLQTIKQPERRRISLV